MNQQSALHAASLLGDVDMVRGLILSSAALDECDADGETPLHLAAFAGQSKTAQLLLVANASVGQHDGSGNTPFHLAASNGHMGILLIFSQTLVSLAHLMEGCIDWACLVDISGYPNIPLRFWPVCSINMIFPKFSHKIYFWISSSARCGEIFPDGFCSFGSARSFGWEPDLALSCPSRAPRSGEEFSWSDGLCPCPEQVWKLSAPLGIRLCSRWSYAFFASSTCARELSEFPWWNTFQLGAAGWFEWGCSNITFLGHSFCF